PRPAAGKFSALARPALPAPAAPPIPPAASAPRNQSCDQETLPAALSPCFAPAAAPAPRARYPLRSGKAKTTTRTALQNSIAPPAAHSILPPPRSPSAATCPRRCNAPPDTPQAPSPTAAPATAQASDTPAARATIGTANRAPARCHRNAAAFEALCAHIFFGNSMLQVCASVFAVSKLGGSSCRRPHIMRLRA